MSHNNNEIEIKLILNHLKQDVSNQNLKDNVALSLDNHDKAIFRDFFYNFKKLPNYQVLKNENLTLNNLYFDTETQELYKNGIALRVRVQNNDCEMTIKTKAKTNVSGVHVHPEYNIALESLPKVPNLSLFPNEIFTDMMNKGYSFKQLQRDIFNNMGQKCEREILLLKEKSTNAEIELSLDFVQYQTQDKGIKRATELELELKQGSPLELYKLLELIVADFEKINTTVKARVSGISKMFTAAIYAGISKLPTVDVLKVSTIPELIKAKDAMEAELFIKPNNESVANLTKFLKETSSEVFLKTLKNSGAEFSDAEQSYLKNFVSFATKVLNEIVAIKESTKVTLNKESSNKELTDDSLILLKDVQNLYLKHVSNKDLILSEVAYGISKLR